MKFLKKISPNNFLQIKKNPKKASLLFVSSLIFLFALTLSFTNQPCKIYAVSPSDYCYKFDLNAVNTTAQDLEYQPVLLSSVDINSWINSFDYIDEYGWQIYPYVSSLAIEENVFLQDLTSLSANQWYIFPELKQGSNDMNVLLGANQTNNIYRNQGFFFNTEDYIQVLDSSDFNNDNFYFKIDFNYKTPDLLQDNNFTIFEKYDEVLNTGIKLTIEHSPTTYDTIRIKGKVDNVNITSSYFVPTGDERIEFWLDGNTLNLIANGLQHTQPVVTYTPNTQDLYIGVDEPITSPKENYLEKVTILDFYAQFGALCNAFCEPVLTLGFNADEITQTSEVPPMYAGTIQDISLQGNTNSGAYYMNRSQTGIDVTTSIISSSTASGSTVFNQSTTNIIGKWWGADNPNSLASGNSNFLGLSFLNVDFYPTNSSGLRLPPLAWYTLWATAFGFVFSIASFFIFRNVPASLFASSVPLILFQIQGLVYAWFVVVYFMVLFAIYSTSLWVERT
tara:strand:- start:1017 stop:2534 length:1518 start_codon:yes stop_codon:yes gene_type:complete